MNIAIFAPYNRPFDIGDNEGSGMNVFIKESVLALKNAGHKVFVFIRKSRAEDKEIEIYDGVTIYKIVAGPEEKLTRNDTYDFCKSNSFPFEKLKGIDIIISHYWISEAWISQIDSLFKGKILYFSHSIGLHRKKSIDYKQIASEIFLSRKVIWCANSLDEKAILENNYLLSNVELVYPGVDVILPKEDLKNKKSQILFAGRKNLSKGADLFVQLAKDFPEHEFKIVGRDDIVIEKIDNLSNLSYISKDKLFSEICNSKLIIHPSRYEHCGLIPIIALKLKVPIIATDTGIAKEILDNNCGLICECDDYKSLKEKFSYFLESFEFVPKINVENMFLWEEFVKRIEEITMKEVNIYEGNIIKFKIFPKLINNRIVNYEQAQLKGSVHILPITNEGKVLLIKEKRVEDDGKHKVRIISGILEDNESYIEATKRELLEETGYEAKDLELFIEISEKNAIKDIRYYVLAYGLKKVKEPNLEETENIIGIEEFSVKELFEKSLNGDFGTSKSVIAINKLYTKYYGKFS